MAVIQIVVALVSQSCLTLCDPVDCIPPGSSVNGILWTRILEWVAIAFSRGSSWPRDRTQASCIADRRLTFWATRKPTLVHKKSQMPSTTLCNSLRIEWRTSNDSSYASCSQASIFFSSQNVTACPDLQKLGWWWALWFLCHPLLLNRNPSAASWALFTLQQRFPFLVYTMASPSQA